LFVVHYYNRIIDIIICQGKNRKFQIFLFFIFIFYFYFYFLFLFLFLFFIFIFSLRLTVFYSISNIFCQVNNKKKIIFCQENTASACKAETNLLLSFRAAYSSSQIASVRTIRTNDLYMAA